MILICNCITFTTNFDKVNVKLYSRGLVKNILFFLLIYFLLILRQKSIFYHQYRIKNLTQILTDKMFDVSRPTVMYVSGWMLSPLAESSQQVINAFLKYQNCNLILLDWSDYSVGFYTLVMIKISQISRMVGVQMTNLFSYGLSDKSFHCVGHSFGGEDLN